MNAAGKFTLGNSRRSAKKRVDYTETQASAKINLLDCAVEGCFELNAEIEPVAILLILRAIDTEGVDGLVEFKPRLR